MLNKVYKTIKFWGIMTGLKMSFYYKFRKERYNTTIFNFLENMPGMYKEFCHEKYSISEKKELAEKIIWVLWWQGETDMPDIVRTCSNSLRRHAGIYKVQYISRENYMDFVDVEEIYVNKLNRNAITITHFSDILRCKLLKKYGGVWMDATILLTDDIEKHINDYDIFSRKSLCDNKNIACGRWSAYFWSAKYKNEALFTFLEYFFLLYHSNVEEIVDYYLIDFGINLAYEKINIVRNQIDAIPQNNKNIYWLDTNANLKCNEEVFVTITQSNYLHKLSWRKNYSFGASSYLKRFIES